MSSEEEDTTEQCFELFGDDKSTSSLLKKQQHQININNNNIINCANNSNSNNNNSNNLNNKRNRQRVDAGEPRNSYSSIPNFSSRPSATALMSGGLYGAIFSQQNSHANANSFGSLFPNGYGPAKMLNELLGRQVKQAHDANGNTNNNNNNNNNSVMMNNGGSEMIESANNNSVKCEFDSNTNNVNNTSTNNSPNTTNNNNNNNNNLIRRPTSGATNNLDMIDDNLSTSPQSAAQQADLAHHMLRNILQGKKDLLALDQELRAVSNGQLSPDGQQKITKNNNNNNLIANNNNLMSNNNNYDTKSDSGAMVNGIIDGNCSNSDKDKENCGTKNNNGDDHTNVDCQKLNKDQEISENIDDDCIMNSIGDSEPSLASPGGSVSNVKLKEECMDGDMDKDMCRSPSPSPSASNKSDQMDMKRARVENIVSGMHSSPVLGGNASSTPIVNGCKKRKLYHPQQHDNSAVERYAVAAAGLTMGLNLHNLMLNDDDDEDELGGGNILQKRVEKNVLKSQLRSMQEQLAEMQQKYVQLCNRMEQNSDTNPEDDDGGSDLDGDDMMRDNVSDKPSPSIVQRTPTASPNKDLPKTPAAQVSHAQTMLNQVMSKMMSAKLHGHLGAHPSMPSPFNGAHPLLQHMQQQNASNDGQMHPQMQHPAFSNAAAMYLSQKLLMEQEARLREKENEERQQQQHQMQQQIQQQQQQMAQKQQELAQKQQQELMQQHQQAQAQAAQNASQAMHQMQQQQQQQQQSQIPPIKTSPQSQQQQRDHQSASNKQSQNVPADLSDRLSMMRSSNNNLGPVSGQDLEGLADILKTEINASLSTLVDSIVSRFVHQRRIMGKQSEAAAAAADQLNKDLLMASQILDRKTPRSKQSAERGSGPGLTNQQHPGSNNMNAVNQLQSGNGQQLSNNNNSSNNNNNTNNNHLHHNHHHPAPVNPLMNHMPNTQDMISQHQQQLNQNSSNNNNNNNNNNNIINNNNNGNNSGPQRMNGQSFGPMGMGGPMHGPGGVSGPDMQSQMNQLSIPSHVRPSPTAAMFQGPSKGPQMNSVAAAALYNSISAMNGQPPNGNNPMNPFYMPEPKQERANEQNEALSLVVTPKKKRHKVTDTRITPRTVSRILAQDALAAAAQQSHMEQQQQQQQQQLQQNNQNSQQNNGIGGNNQNGNSGNPMMNGNSGNKSFNNSPINVPASIPNEMPSPRSNFHHPPPSMLPVSLPTSVAIPNPSLHESQVFSPYSPFFNPHGPPHGPHGPQSSQLHHMKMSSSPPGLGGMMDPRDSPPLPHPTTMLHPALLAAAHHGGSPDYGHIRAAMDGNDRNSDCNSADITYDGMQQSMSFSNAFLSNFKNENFGQNSDNGNDQFSLNSMHSATLTPMHLRKAKLMFFWVRYPSSAVLKMYFPDIKFNKNNTAQLVKWFSNFREFYYIQMEKYARQAVSEGVKSVDDIHVSGDSEIYRVLNLHYNRNNHIEVPPNFRFVVEQTLREFFRAIQGGKDTEQSWKKSIYKVISRMDDPVPEYFKSPNFLEQLE